MDWSTWSPWVYYVLLLGLLLCGLAVQLMGLPGLWLMAGSALGYAWLTGWDYLGLPGLITIFALCLLGELIEFLARAGGAKNAGGSKRSMVGGIVGGVIGGVVLSVPLPIVGTIIGVCIGAFIGATLAQLTVKKDVEHSTRVGLGAAKGTLIGILSKLTVGCVIFLVTAIIALPFGGDGTPASAAASATQPAIGAAPTATQPASASTEPAEELDTTRPPDARPATLPAVERE